MLEVGVLHAQSLRPWRVHEVAQCLPASVSINIDGVDDSLRITLCQNEGYESAAGTYVEDVCGSVVCRPGTKKHTIGAYLHGAPFIVDCKMFKTEHKSDRRDYVSNLLSMS